MVVTDNTGEIISIGPNVLKLINNNHSIAESKLREMISSIALLGKNSKYNLETTFHKHKLGDEFFIIIQCHIYDFIIFIVMSPKNITKQIYTEDEHELIIKKLEDKEFYLGRCTVLNGTLAWDITGNYDPEHCIDIDPYTVYNDSMEVSDPLKDSA